MKIAILNDCNGEIDTPKLPQSQVDAAYTQFLEARKASLERAIGEALYWLDCGSPGRAVEALRRVGV